MCMLTYYEADTKPDLDALYNGTRINTDGHGYAIVVPTKEPKLIVKHSLDADEILNKFDEDRTKYPDGPALFHSRWATSGSNGRFNCHPFYVQGDRRTVVAHNGILPRNMQPEDSDIRCDTRLAADQIFANRYGHLSKDIARARLADAIGFNNKLVILTIDPAYSQWSYLINSEAGIWEGDTWYSNYDFEPFKPMPLLPNNYSYGSYGGEMTNCHACFAEFTVDSITRICAYCATCNDCMSLLCTCDVLQDGEPTEAEWLMIR